MLAENAIRFMISATIALVTKHEKMKAPSKVIFRN